MNTIIIITLVVIAALVYVIVTFNRACDKAEKERLENLPGVHFLYEDGTTCLRFYVHEEDGKVWLHDYGRKIMQPSAYDSMEQLVRSLKVGRGWKYKIIPIILLTLCFGFFSCQTVDAREIEEYQQLSQEYFSVLEKSQAVYSIDEYTEEEAIADIYNRRVNENLLDSKNVFLKAIALWQVFQFLKEVYELEIVLAYNFLESRVSMNLAKNSNPVLKMVYIWQVIALARDVVLEDLMDPWDDEDEEDEE